MKLHLLSKTLRTTLLIIVFTAGVVFAGPNDTVTVGLNIDPTTINVLETKIGLDIVMQHMHESILFPDPVKGDLEPVLASKISIMPNRKDIKVILEKNHTFHNGEPITAKDVKWTYEQAVTPENAHLIAASLEEIEDIEIINDYTLIFHYYEPFAPWPENMWIGICSKNYFEKVGREKFRTQPVGSGPFKFVSRSIGENVIMQAADGYTYPESIYNKAKTKIIKRKAKKKMVDFKTLKFISARDPITRAAIDRKSVG